MKSLSFLFNTVFFLLLLSSQKANAQTYSQGGLTVNNSSIPYHDTTLCASILQESWDVFINNATNNDSVIIKDQNGQVLAYAINSTNQNPWFTILFPTSMVNFVTDDNIIAGNATFNSISPIKFIHKQDSIVNITPNVILPVSDPCIYNTVAGKVFIDNNDDCNYNTGDVALKDIPIKIIDSLSGNNFIPYNILSDINGNISQNIQQSWMTKYAVSIPAFYKFIFPMSTCTPLSYNFTALPQSNVNFILKCTSGLDIQADAFKPSFIKPLQPFLINPYVSNIGCDTASGELILIKDTKAIYNPNSSMNPASYVNGDTLKWSFNNLTNVTNNGYWNSFFVGANFSPNGGAVIGDTLHFKIFTDVVQFNDVNPSNNYHEFYIPVLQTTTTNNKEVMPKGEGPNGNIGIDDTLLEYTINFQNTGNATAYNVTIIDTLENNIVPSSLKILGSTHSLTPEWLAPNVVKFNFFGINLPDTLTNKIFSNGSVRFSVKVKSGLSLGTQIKNKGYIYFDTKPAIVTNQTINTILYPSGVANVFNMNNVLLYPNPAHDKISIEIPQYNNGNGWIKIYSINGQVVKHSFITKSKTDIDVSHLPTGLYFIQTHLNGQTSQMKFLKN